MLETMLSNKQVVNFIYTSLFPERVPGSGFGLKFQKSQTPGLDLK
jgi:hypothetical protein